MHTPQTKVFGIGFQKTGTSTLKYALQLLGFKVKGGGSELIEPLKQNDWKPVWDTVHSYDAFEDHPWPTLYKELDRSFPGSKFILTVRDKDSWIKSVVNHLGCFPAKMQSWTYGIGFPAGFEDLYVKKYERHNKEVLAYFRERPGDLLVVDWTKGDGWRELCPFLGREIPDTAFPHRNKGRYNMFKTFFWRVSGRFVTFNRKGIDKLFAGKR